MKLNNSICLVATALLFAVGPECLSKAAVEYDVTILDGTHQVRDGNPVIPPLSVDVEFPNTPAALADGLLEISAFGDFGASTENLLVFTESHSLGTLFVDGGDNVLGTESLVIPLVLLQEVTADGAVGIRLEGTSAGGPNVNEMTIESVRLAYTAVPEPSSWAVGVVAMTCLLFTGRKWATQIR